MKYSPDLAHKILLYLEANDVSETNGEILVEGHSEDEISYHIKILHKQGLVEGLDASSFGKTHWQAKDLTPAGHIFLQKKQDKMETSSKKVANTQIDSKIVFVVHGRNSAARKALFQFLRSIGLQPLEWAQAVEETGKPSPYVGEILDKALSIAQAAIILFTPDDEARLKGELRGDKEPKYEIELTGQARPNVIFEAGMAMGMYPDRTVLVELGDLRPISDIGGRYVIRLNNSVARRQELAQRLKTAGCAVNLSGTDWHEDGNFDIPNLAKIQSDETGAKIEIKSSEPDETETNILKTLAQENDSFHFIRIQEDTKLHPIILQHNLESLLEKKYVKFDSEDESYKLSKKGREFAIKNNLLGDYDEAVSRVRRGGYGGGGGSRW